MARRVGVRDEQERKDAISGRAEGPIRQRTNESAIEVEQLPASDR